jgi:S-methylmethionine-dependent homocysteine/selenocysteine methylase
LELDAMNRKAIALMEELRTEYASNASIVISGCVGPQSDGYSPATMLTPDEAQAAYDSTQIATFADTSATHFEAILEPGAAWAGRIGGLRANASSRSHAELDEGDPIDLGERHAALTSRLPKVNVLAGCCGTDHRHVEAICTSWLAEPART